MTLTSFKVMSTTASQKRHWIYRNPLKTIGLEGLRAGSKGPPIENVRESKWSRDRWRHVTPIRLEPISKTSGDAKTIHNIGLDWTICSVAVVGYPSNSLASCLCNLRHIVLWRILQCSMSHITLKLNSPVMHRQNFKRLCMGVQSSPMFIGKFCAFSLTYQWTVYIDL